MLQNDKYNKKNQIKKRRLKLESNLLHLIVVCIKMTYCQKKKKRMRIVI